MAGNSFGDLFKITTFGESHGEAIGGIIDGCPAKLIIDKEFIKKQLYRRSTGVFFSDSDRKEDDEVVFLSGINQNNETLGTPIAFYVKNKDKDSSYYEEIKNVYRPSHADYTYDIKYGIRDYRGGGRASARETVARLVAGSIAMMFLEKIGVSFNTYTCQIGPYRYTKDEYKPDFNKVANSPIACPDEELSIIMLNYLEKLKREKNSTGGIVACVINGAEAGIGEPIFDKLQAELAKAMMSIPAAKAFEYGLGFKAASLTGSEHNDIFVANNKLSKNKNTIKTVFNKAGGILGGITTGEDIYFKVAFKPIPSIGIMQKAIDKNANLSNIELKGRFDTCVIPRVLPIVETMAAIVIADFLLKHKAYQNI